MEKKKQRPRQYGLFHRFFRCTDQGPGGSKTQVVPGCGAIKNVKPSVCLICGAEGSYRSFVARKVFEVSWWLRPRLVGYLTREGTFIKLVPVSDVDVTRGILE